MRNTNYTISLLILFIVSACGGGGGGGSSMSDGSSGGGYGSGSTNSAPTYNQFNSQYFCTRKSDLQLLQLPQLMQIMIP
jgi:hypothetical protein